MVIRRIKPEQVRLGMYVAGLGGSFFDHPFWRTRFKLTAQSDVDRIRASSIPYVEIDDVLGCGPVDEPGAQSSSPKPLLVDRIGENRAKRLMGLAFQKGGLAAISRTEQFDRAGRAVARATTIVQSLFDAGRLGKDVPIAEAMQLVEEIDHMFARGEDALLDVVRMKAEDQYTYLHSVAVCALMVKFARHLEMPEAEVRECGLGGLLHDVGKARIPAEVLHKPGRLSPDEYALVRSHAAEGYSILQGALELSDAVKDVARLHHERMDGSGYPLGLPGDQIPLFARMGAICDVYDALTSNRSYKPAWAPSEAIEKMFANLGHFDEPLLHAFAQCIGVALPQQAAMPDQCVMRMAVTDS